MHDACDSLLRCGQVGDVRAGPSHLRCDGGVGDGRRRDGTVVRESVGRLARLRFDARQLLVFHKCSCENSFVTKAPLADAPSLLAGSRRRDEILALLRQADTPLSVTEVADAMRLHVNTARFHLDGLADEGFAERTTESRERRGRPRILYSSEGRSPGPRSYGLLAEMLTGLVVSLDNAGPATVEVGKEWGRHLVERVAPSTRIKSDEAIARLNRMLGAVGFQSETHATEEGAELWLRHCPFREVAEKHMDVVCALHLGLMQGALDELGAPVSARSLEPFVTPQMCIARLSVSEG